MPKYKFNIEEKPLTDQEIEKNKDFSKVVFRYQKGTRPLYKYPLYRFKNRKVWMIIILILLVAYLIILFGSK